jgi:hypothetical protein
MHGIRLHSIGYFVFPFSSPVQNYEFDSGLVFDLLGLDVNLLGGGLASRGILLTTSLLVIGGLVGGGLDTGHSAVQVSEWFCVALFGRDNILVAAVLGLVLLLVSITTTIASTTATATTSSTSSTSSTTSTTSATSSVLEAVLLVVVPSLLPVVVAFPWTTTTSSLTGLLALVKLARVAVVGFDLSLSDEIVLLVAVSTLAHDLEVMVVPLGSRVHLDKFVGLLLVGKCDEDRALEEVLVRASELEALNLAELGKEALEIELSVGSLVTEALDVNGSSLDLGFGGGHGLIRGLALDLLLALLAGEVEDLAILESSNDGAVRLECSHALERVDSLDLHGLVFASAA